MAMQWRGVIPAITTPFNAHGRPELHFWGFFQYDRSIPSTC